MKLILKALKYLQCVGLASVKVLDTAVILFSLILTFFWIRFNHSNIWRVIFCMAVENISTLRPHAIYGHALTIRKPISYKSLNPSDKSSMRLLFEQPMYQYDGKIARITNSISANAPTSQWNIVSLQWLNYVSFWEERTKVYNSFSFYGSHKNQKCISIFVFVCICVCVCLKFSPKHFHFHILSDYWNLYSMRLHLMHSDYGENVLKPKPKTTRFSFSTCSSIRFCCAVTKSTATITQVIKINVILYFLWTVSGIMNAF